MTFEEKEWDLHIPMAEFTINNIVNISPRFTLFYLNKSYHPVILANLLSQIGDISIDSVKEWVKRLNNNVKQAEQAMRYA